LRGALSLGPRVRGGLRKFRTWLSRVTQTGDRIIEPYGIRLVHFNPPGPTLKFYGYFFIWLFSRNSNHGWFGLLGLLFLLTRVLDTYVVNAEEHLQKRLLNQSKVLEGQVRLIQLAILNSFLKNKIDERLEAIVRRIVEAPARCFN
jgi:hypothetical protein